MSRFGDSFVHASAALVVAIDTPDHLNFAIAWREALHAEYASHTSAEYNATENLKAAIVNAAQDSDVNFLPYRVTYVDVDSGDEITTGFPTWELANNAVAAFHRNNVPAHHAR